MSDQGFWHLLYMNHCNESVKCFKISPNVSLTAIKMEYACGVIKHETINKKLDSLIKQILLSISCLLLVAVILKATGNLKLCWTSMIDIRLANISKLIIDMTHVWLILSWYALISVTFISLFHCNVCMCVCLVREGRGGGVCRLNLSTS